MPARPYVSPGQPPWIPAPGPWWVWAIRAGIALAFACLGCHAGYAAGHWLADLVR